MDGTDTTLVALAAALWEGTGAAGDMKPETWCVMKARATKLSALKVRMALGVCLCKLCAVLVCVWCGCR